MTETWFYSKVHRSPPPAIACLTGLSILAYVWQVQILVIACCHHGSLALGSEKEVCPIFCALPFSRMSPASCSVVRYWGRHLIQASYSGSVHRCWPFGRSHGLNPTLHFTVPGMVLDSKSIIIISSQARGASFCGNSC